jgi:hypothetical protein
MPQAIGGAQALVVPELAWGPARVMTRQVILGRAAQSACDQQGVGKDIQHGLSPFGVSMISFAMKADMLRFIKTSNL